MQNILTLTAVKNNVAPQFLEYVGMQDERTTVGKIIYLFNIMDDAHPRFKSTVSFIQPNNQISPAAGIGRPSPGVNQIGWCDDSAGDPK